MFKSRHFYQRLIPTLISILFSSSLIIVPFASAAPGYDDHYQTIGSVETGASGYYSINCDTTNISTTWQQYITDSSTWYNPSDATNPNSTSYKAKASFEAALAHGRWGVSQRSEYGGGGYFRAAIVFWTEDDSMSLSWNSEGVDASGAGVHAIGIGCRKAVYGNGGSEPIAWGYFTGGVRISNDTPYNPAPTSTSEAYGIANFFAHTDHPNYPSGYSGQVVTLDEDIDGDGLNAAQEAVQGTSDTNKDTDGDGLSDFTESQWNPDKDAVFCGSICAYPDPTKKDLYVEIDWMKDSSNNVFKPSTDQIALAQATYAAHEINAHFDTGQYGGGNELPSFSGNLIFVPTDNQLDFYDLKNGTSTITANFNESRKNIWHYMITGYNFKQTDSDTNADETGTSFAGDDDSIISIQRVEQLNPTDLDTAVAGTMVHELGHNLCLSQHSLTDYPNQPAACIYGEIDKPLDQNPSQDYVSVMNYRFQLSSTDYSNGTNGAPGDHDDWQAINLGMGDFQHSVYEWYSTQNQQRSSKSLNKSNQITRQSMINDLQE